MAGFRWPLQALLVLVLAAAAAVQAAPDIAALAAQLYPGHALLQLQPAKTSAIQASLARALAASSSGGSDNGLLVVLQSKVVDVDTQLTVRPGQRLVLATPAALQAATADTGRQQAGRRRIGVPEAQLLSVRCKPSKSGRFMTAAEPAALHLLGLSISNCAEQALQVKGGGQVLLQDMKLTGHNAPQGDGQLGGAVLVERTQKLVFRRVACVGNFAKVKGGCLAAQLNEEVELTDSSFVRNWKDDPDIGGGAGAVYAELNRRVTVTNCDAHGNTAIGVGSLGGAMLFLNSGPVLVQGSRFSNNSAELEGGALQASDVELVTIVGCNFTRNGPLPVEMDGSPLLTSTGAAVGVVNGKVSGDYPLRLVINASRFVDNEGDAGGAVSANQWSLDRARVEVHGSYFSGNQGFQEAGAIYMNENFESDVIVNSTVFEGNWGVYGGALSLYDSNILVTNCAFTNNTSDSDGGAIQLQTNMAVGSRCMMRVVDSVFRDNVASDGMGGAIAVDSQGLSLSNVTITNSQALQGGGVSVMSADLVEMSDVLLADNTATVTKGSGGGIKITATDNVTLSRVLLTRNRADQGGAIHLSLVTSARLSGVNISANTANELGGGMSLTRCRSVAMADSSMSANTAQVGGGIAADATDVALTRVTIDGHNASKQVGSSGESAGADDGSEDAGRRRLSQDAGNDRGGDADGSVDNEVTFVAQVYVAGTAGGLLLQNSALQLRACTFANNTAARDAGGALVLQPSNFTASDSTFASNTASSGLGGGLIVRGTSSRPALARLARCRFSRNSAVAKSGGAVLVDSGLGPVDLACDGCEFDANTAGQDGGGVAAVGQTLLACDGCESSGNTAGQAGGWLSCTGCSMARLDGASASNNSAGVGGAVSCDACGRFSADGGAITANAARGGGGLALSSTADVKLRGVAIADNSASANHSHHDTSGVEQLTRAAALPAAWQALYGVGGAAAGTNAAGCSGGGAGGGLCVSAAGQARLDGVALTNNSGGTGGGAYASVACVAGDGGNCSFQLVNTSATGNTASEAGGALYTSTPHALTLASSESGMAASQEQRRKDQADLLRALDKNNNVDDCGYGAGAASSPVRLALLHRELANGMANTADAGACGGDSGAGLAMRALHGWDAKQGGTGGDAAGDTTGGGSRRRLLQLEGLGRSIITSISQNTGDRSYGAIDGAAAAGIELPPVCPALGATVTDDTAVQVDASQLFKLPVFMLDVFDSRVTKGPGSNWLVSLEQPPRNDSGVGGGDDDGIQLVGAARGRLVAGNVTLDELVLASPPDQNILLNLSAVPGQVGQQQVQGLNTIINVTVRPCLPGQRLQLSSSSTGGTSATCSMCAPPTFSFQAYPEGWKPGASVSMLAGSSAGAISGGPAAADDICRGCPAGGVCVAGMVIPQNGAFQPHPRSATIRPCPHGAACTRIINDTQGLHALQCASRRFINAKCVNSRPYTALQCASGYAGPFCSACWRPGRNAWLLDTATWEAARKREREEWGCPPDSIQDEVELVSRIFTSVRNASGFSAKTAYGRANGRCMACPHVALAWLRFLLARLVDLGFVALLALLWLGLGWLAASRASADYDTLKAARAECLSMRGSVLGGPSLSRRLSGSASLSQLLAPAGSRQVSAAGGSDRAGSMFTGPPSSRVSSGAGGSQVSLLGGGVPGSAAGSATGIWALRRGSRGSFGSGGGSVSAGGGHEPMQRPIASPGWLTGSFGGASHGSGTGGHGHASHQPLPGLDEARSEAPLAPAPSVGSAASGGSMLGAVLLSFRQRLRRPTADSVISTGSAMYSLSQPVGSVASFPGPLSGWSAAAHALNAQAAALNSCRPGSGPGGAGLVVGDDAELAKLLAELGALLLMAVRHLACLAQVMLDGAQVAGVLLAQDLLWQLPDWAATGLSAVLMTQATTWQWVPFECLLPPDSPASAAVLQALLAMVLPALYVAVLLPLLLWLHRTASEYASGFGGGVAAAASGATTREASSIPAADSAAPPGAMPAASMGSIDAPLPPLPGMAPNSQPSSGSASTAAPSPFVVAARGLLPPPPQQQPSVAPPMVPPGAAGGDATLLLPPTVQQRSVEHPRTPVKGAGSGVSAKSAGSATSRLKQRLWPLSRTTWALLTALAVSSMAYCFAFYASTVVGAFSCMAQARKPSVPGEFLLEGTYWVPDMQLRCWRGSHIAVAMVAFLIGLPTLLAYVLLLLVLAWPEATAPPEPASDDDDSLVGGVSGGPPGWHGGSRRYRSGPPGVLETRNGPVLTHTAAHKLASMASPGKAGSGGGGSGGGGANGGPLVLQVSLPGDGGAGAASAAAAGGGGGSSDAAHAASVGAWLGTTLRQWLLAPGVALRTLWAAVVALPGRILEPAVRRCQAYTQRVGLSGTAVAGLGVWNMDWRWWWLVVRELVKLCIVLVAVVSSMRAPHVQAMLVLLLVVLSAALTWGVQAGCSTTMSRMMYVSQLWLQGLALLALLLTLPGVSSAALGGVLLGSMVLVVTQVAALLGALVWRCLRVGRLMGEVHLVRTAEL